MTSLVELVERSQSTAAAGEFTSRVESRADELKTALADGTLDNEDFAVGLEMEVYAIDPAEHVLTRLPNAVFEAGAGKELGLHNAELNTDPDVFSEEGLERQADRIESAMRTASGAAQDVGCELVLDAMWTLAPAEGSEAYLTAVEDRDGVTVASNMRPDPRYVAIDNDVLAAADGAITFEVPGMNQEFPTILLESLATSIQPHLQIPSAASFPAYYNAAIRTLGPVLALSTNSPFLPHDLYTAVDEPRDLLEATHHELRIEAFEQSVNQSPNDKVRVPDDIETTVDSIDNVVADDTCAPFLREWLHDDDRDTFAEQNWEFTHKRSTYWRWVRAVIGGDSVAHAGDERSIRIEYRPIPTQPTVRDVVSFQALVAGLLRGLVDADHPIVSLPWHLAERSFYNAAADGLDAHLEWVTEDGLRTTESAEIFEEVFTFARHGLAAGGLSASAIDRYLEPLEARVEAGVTPSSWKIERVRAGLEDGLDLTDAMRRMQIDYLELQRETDSFAQWL